MELAYVASSRVPSRAANTVNVLNMSSAFAGEGHSVTLFARGDGAAGEEIFIDFALSNRFDVDLLELTRPRWLDRLRFVRHIRRRLACKRFDLAYGRSCYALLAGIPPSLPFGYDLHIFPSRWQQRQMESAMFRRKNFLFATAITRAVADKYLAVYPHLQGRMLVAPCGAALVERLTKPRFGGPTRVYYVGHLYRGRGIDLIVDIARAEPQIEFHVVGGEEADIGFWARQGPANLTFHGYVTPAQLSAHYERADICIAPHGLIVAGAGGGDIAPWMSPMKIFEYLAHGKAVVAADLPVLREILTPGVDCMLCAPGDLDDWRQAIVAISADEELRNRLGEAGRRKFERNYTWEQRARKILDFAKFRMADKNMRPASRRRRQNGRG